MKIPEQVREEHDIRLEVHCQQLVLDSERNHTTNKGKEELQASSKSTLSCGQLKENVVVYSTQGSTKISGTHTSPASQHNKRKQR